MSNVCEILAVGTEILLGDIINTDAAYIAGRLAALGFSSYRQTVVGDNDGRLCDAIREAFGRADILILTGGLGPTCDDITKTSVAEVFGLPLERHEETVAELEKFFRERNRVMTENNLAQAMLPRGAVVFANDWGTAPGAAVVGVPLGMTEEKTAILLPGPPSECEPMFTERVEPWLAARSGFTIHSLNLHLYGIGESGAEAILRPIMEQSLNPTVAPYACEHEVRIRITAKGETTEECRALCEAMAERIKATEAGQYIYTSSETPWEAKNAIVLKLIDSLRQHGAAVAAAESCTAGMFCSRIGDIPGASDILLGGVVSYANEVKENVLGVPGEILRTVGAVSEPCAGRMAEGVRRITGADIAVSITGIAGPGGGTAEKPVGTVCFGVADAHGTVTETVHFGYKSDRAKIRRLSVARAMMNVIHRLEGRDV
ncbi:MAG: competence/damage-inducible protein A [Clostridia bacterium]|nr:competence/damage-inducible protein A [Clostridia bacterium]